MNFLIFQGFVLRETEPFRQNCKNLNVIVYTPVFFVVAISGDGSSSPSWTNKTGTLSNQSISI